MQLLADDQGWFHTQDRGVMVQGELRVFGRLDNLFFSGGEGVQPEDIERVLATHPQILQVFVVPMDDMEFGQRPVAVIDSERPLTLEALLNWAQERLASFQRPAALFNLPNELNKGGIKISRQQLQQWVAVQISAA
ncbi:AMP-binding enzyme [Serratia symbiotica]|uniref:Uncharacterized protein n=1 Tax=Serratia symbiotica TaxID=138074 RepID=A0A7D5NQR1_9GAMM|nr:hypothetical protein [Serratia symbiotica]MBF1995133.1 hypothetical protein [Serratia symbiotica]MBQ0956314.1 hypothetical protein [Serratia symbiotica]QLH62830.1 hypothetical protein SYMBAF_07675 [Serratia symbiotica]QTP15981.1 hypothetical protein GPZ83_0006190 [Serratia symbiotica]